MKLKKEFILRNIAGQDVIVATGSEAMRYNGLLTVNESGKFILENYQNTDNVIDMIRLVCEEFEVDRDTAVADVMNFNKAMLEHGFIEMDNPEKNW